MKKTFGFGKIALILIIFLSIGSLILLKIASTNIRHDQLTATKKLLEVEIADYIYDLETDILIASDTLNKRSILMDLSTKEIIFDTESPAGSLFYVPGKYIALNSKEIYSLPTRTVLQLKEVKDLDYNESKVGLLEILNIARNEKKETYSYNNYNYHTFLIIDNNLGYSSKNILEIAMKVLAQIADEKEKGNN